MKMIDQDLPIAVEPQVEHKAPVSYDAFAKIGFRVGTVAVAERMPRKRVLRLEVDIGSERRQFIVGKGLPERYPPETLVGRQVVFFTNLKPKLIGDRWSQGMILAVGDNVVEGLITFDEPCAPGSLVT
jgi:tRNA-binding protein